MQTIATIAAACPPLLAGAARAPTRPSSSPRALKVLADPARLRLLSLIQAQPDGEACVCHLTEPLGLTQPTVSHHLKVLLEAGLVEREQRGSWAYFRVVPGTARSAARAARLTTARHTPARQALSQNALVNAIVRERVGVGLGGTRPVGDKPVAGLSTVGCGSSSRRSLERTKHVSARSEYHRSRLGVSDEVAQRR